MLEEKYIYTTPIGQILLKTEDRLLKEISFLNEETTPAVNSETLRSSILLETIASLDNYFSGKDLSLDLPVAQAGTAFQQEVWKALLQIKPGYTESYLGLSKIIGNQKAIRAVGAANGKNKIALVVPCHRVIGSNGNLVGYASGVWRKNWLLKHEAKHTGRITLLF